MKLIAIDIGNSNAKFACFEQDKLLKHYRIDNADAVEDTILKLMVYEPDYAILSTVKKEGKLISKILANFGLEPILFSELKKIPIKNNYETPKTLGSDRLLNAIAAKNTFPMSPVLVIDAGTCIKFDFVNEFGEYVGGSIAPGVAMRFKALNHFTDALPLLELTESFYLIGRNTQESIQSGVLNGVIAEVKGIIEQYQMAQKNLKIVLTGGDYLLFERNLKISIFADSNFTLKGLNEAFKFQFAQATDA